MGCGRRRARAGLAMQGGAAAGGGGRDGDSRAAAQGARRAALERTPEKPVRGRSGVPEVRAARQWAPQGPVRDRHRGADGLAAASAGCWVIVILQYARIIGCLQRLWGRQRAESPSTTPS